MFFWRAQKYNSKKEQEISHTKRRLTLRRWHGPGLLVATEGNNGTDVAANCFISFRGQLTKCPSEHVRKASSLESIAAGSWEAAIDEVIRAAQRDGVPADVEADQSVDPSAPSEEVALPTEPVLPLAVAAIDPQANVSAPALTPSEVIAALRPEGVGGSLVSSQPSLDRFDDVGSQRVGLGLTAAPGTPVADLVRRTSRLSSSSSLQRTFQRARSLDSEESRGLKRAASQGLFRPSEPRDGVHATSTDGATSIAPVNSVPLDEQAAFEALTMTMDQLNNIAENDQVHPLLRLQAQVDLDRRAPLENLEYDHGTWDGRWAFMCERDWQVVQELGLQLLCGQCDNDIWQFRLQERSALGLK